MSDPTPVRPSVGLIPELAPDPLEQVAYTVAQNARGEKLRVVYLEDAQRVLAEVTGAMVQEAVDRLGGAAPSEGSPLEKLREVLNDHLGYVQSVVADAYQGQR